MNPMKQLDDLRAYLYGCLERRDFAAAMTAVGELARLCPAEAAGLRVSIAVEQGDAAAAKAALPGLLALAPEEPYTVFLTARVLFMERRYVSARKVLDTLREPERIAPAYREKIENLRGQCCRILGRSREAAESYLAAACSSSTRELAAMEYSNYLFNLHYLTGLTAAQRRQAAAGYQKLFEGVEAFRQHRHQAGNRLRIGFISPDFRHHVVLCFCYALLTGYDRTRFEVYAYMTGPEDQDSQLLRRHVDSWRSLQGMTAADAAAVIYADGVDILIDLSGHTRNNALPVLAFRPAPVQVSGIGYFASTGLAAVDYFIGDACLDDETVSAEFTEKLLVLPHSHFCYHPFEETPLPRESAFLRNGYVTFGSFNHFAKVSDAVLGGWRQILTAVPDSHLLLKASIFDGGEAEDYARRRMERAGFPMLRVECRGISHDYLAEYADMDIALDTFPYPGGGTSCDALYMGRPLITLTGDSHGSRFGKGLLHSVGLDELCADCPEAYVERAVGLARDKELLHLLHIRLRAMMQASPLMDEQQYRAEMAELYETIWHRYLTGGGSE